jgi:hypothetical protein
MIYLVKGIVRQEMRGVGVEDGIIQTVMTFLGQFKGLRLLKLQKNRFRRLGSKRGQQF